MKLDERKIKVNWTGSWSNYFVSHIQLVFLLIILVLLLGYVSYQSLAKESLPEITFPALSIQVVYPGASAEDVESLITDKIESKLLSLDDLDNISSSSNFGFTFITVSFEEGVDMDRKKLEVENKLSEVDLPEESLKPQIVVFNTSEFPLLSFSLVGDYSEDELTFYAQEISKRLEKLSGIEEVTIFGEKEREFQVLLNPIKMMSYQVSTRQIQNALSGLNVALPITEIEEGGIRYNFRIDQKIETVEEIGNVSVLSSQNESILINDVGRVIDTKKESNEINRSYVTNSVTGEKEIQPSIFLQVIRTSDQDVLQGSAKVREELDKMKGIIYPEDITVYISQDTADFVSEDLDNIQNSALSGLIVVIIVLFLFIGFKESLVVALSIPLSLLGTLGLLSFFGMTLNTLVVLGIIVSLGLLVDNSIIVMENMNRLRLKGYNAKEASVFGVNQVGFPIFAATLTTIAAFFPLAILPGIVGAFINSIPRTVIITLVCSFFVAVTVIPSLYYLLFKEREANKEGRYYKIKEGFKKHTILKIFLQVTLIVVLSLFAFSGPEISIVITIIITALFAGLLIIKLTRFKDDSFESSKVLIRYQNSIEKVVSSTWRKGVILSVALLLLMSSFVLIGAGLLKISFFPQNEPDNITLVIDAPGGTTLEEMNEITREVEEILMTSPEVSSFNTTIGGAEVDRASINIELADTEETGFSQLAILKSQTENIPGAEVIIQGQSSGGPPVETPINIVIEGDDLIASTILAEEYVDVLEDIEGVYNVNSSASKGSPEKVYQLNSQKAQYYGISPVSLAVELRNIMAGSVATEMIVDGEEIEVITKIEPEYSEKIEDIYVSTVTGQMIPLSAIGKLVTQNGYSSIQHSDGIREISITADVFEGYNSGEILDEFMKTANTENLDNGLIISFGGDSEAIQESFYDLLRSMILAIFLVFIILSLQFNSIVQPLIIVLTIPMAIIGVMWGLFITGNEFGFYAFMALVALVGIAVNDAIVLIDYMNQLRRSNMPFIESIGEAARTRFNPVIATTLTTIGGILPLAFNNVYYQQFAYALIFGLLVTTFMTLILIPIFYSIFSKNIKLDINQNLETSQNEDILQRGKTSQEKEASYDEN